MFTLSFDQRSLSEIAQFAGFSVFLTEEMATAMQDAGDILTSAAIANTWLVFTNPTGELASSIAPVLDSPYEVQIGVGVPYGRRQEEGGGGLFDSLGRRMTNPAKPYLAPALTDNQQAVLQRLDQAVERALARIGGE